MKKNIITVFTICFILTLLTSCSSSDSQESSLEEVSPPEQVITAEDAPMMIDPADQQCLQKEDCTITAIQCSCNCGAPINKDHRSKYDKLIKQKCENYDGKMCKIDCSNYQEVTCENNVCIFPNAK